MCAAAGVLLVGSPSLADSFENLRGGDVSEQSHAVRVTLGDGFAQYRVRRSIRNDGDFTDQIGLSINLPAGAAVDGLRVRSRGAWHAGILMKADDASARYGELTDTDREASDGEPLATRPPVLLEWEGTGSVSVSAFPVAVGESVTFEYMLLAPTCWGNGRQYLQYPTDNARKGFVAPLLAVTTGSFGGKVTLHRPTAPAIEGMVCGDGVVSNGDAHTTIEIEAPAIEQAAARYGLFKTESGRFVARLDIDAAAILEPLPKRARVVFVLDGSWSTEDDRLSEQLALVRGYLNHVPDAHFEVVVFRRYAERLFGQFESAELFDQLVLSVPARDRVLGNGSNLEQGVALAANLLSGASGPARVVVFTDERTRKAYSNDLAIAAASSLPRQAVLHVVDRTSSYGVLNAVRDDDSQLAPLAAAFGGVLSHVNGETSDPDVVTNTMLGLVRPIRIDRFAVEADGVVELEGQGGSALEEGEGRRSMALIERKPERVRLTGMIWGRKWSRALAPHGALSAAIPSLLFGDDVHSSLTEQEQLAAAMTAGAVSMYTSYLAAEDRPIPLPEDEDMLGLRGYTSGCGCCSASSRCGFSTRCGGVGFGSGRLVTPPRHDDLLRGFMKSALESCGRAAGVERFSARLIVEATTTEVVDVTVEGELSADLHDCIEDGAWEVRLSSEFDQGLGSYPATLHWSAGQSG